MNTGSVSSSAASQRLNAIIHPQLNSHDLAHVLVAPYSSYYLIVLLHPGKSLAALLAFVCGLLYFSILIAIPVLLKPTRAINLILLPKSWLMLWTDQKLQ
ncbi:hypothetical protein J3R83DRAFT_2534 [Lanmaoa asiatica]|nr:hypothetical protein J3R83DRAFT_2534 [Lanmaoa asiatica]